MVLGLRCWPPDAIAKVKLVNQQFVYNTTAAVSRMKRIRWQDADGEPLCMQLMLFRDFASGGGGPRLSS